MNPKDDSTWGYAAFFAIRKYGTFTTADGILIAPTGCANNVVSQGYVFSKDDKTVALKGFWGSETLFRSLDKARNGL